MKGKRYRIETTSETRASAGHKKRNGILIGGGAGLGAALGAAAGGGKGALIGAGAGGAAGTAGAAATGKENVAFPAETALRFSLKGPVRI
jgi:outer membrane lipoprotein SlyB